MGNKVATLLTTRTHERKRGCFLSRQKNEQTECVHVGASKHNIIAISNIEDHREERQEQPDVRLQNPTFLCKICFDEKPQNQSFNMKGCTHFYCSDCMVGHVVSKLQDNVFCIRCPVYKCEGVLEPEHCRQILPAEVFDRWGNALCESLILASQKLYCPYNDCSGPLLLDGSGKVLRQSKCPYCGRLFCAQCKVPWHLKTDCNKFQKLNKPKRGKEDGMLRDLAKRNKWRRCPSCKFYVEKSEGCSNMICRCGFRFCYDCGAPLKSYFHKYFSWCGLKYGLQCACIKLTQLF